MPCTYTGSFEGDAAMFAREELDDITKKLCATCQALDDAGVEIPAGVKTWWRRHKVADAKRRKREGEGEK